jgi:hypothetical protein
MKKSSQLLRYCIVGVFSVILMTSLIFRNFLPNHFHHAIKFLSSETIIGNGNVITRIIPVGGFDTVNVDGKFNLFINNDKKNTCTLITDENIFPKIAIGKTNNMLSISSTDSFSINPKIIITSNTINQLNISGKTELHATNLNTDHLSVMMSGKSSGIIEGDIKNITFNLNGKSELHATLPHADHINVNINGKGTIYLTGKSKTLTIISHGKANMIAKDMIADDIVIESAGESTMTLDAKKSLTVQAFGKSDIQYLGEPTITKNIFGKSTLTKIQ